jgi:hypothetical protein
VLTIDNSSRNCVGLNQTIFSSLETGRCACG